jgi:hypothetical protein
LNPILPTQQKVDAESFFISLKSRAEPLRHAACSAEVCLLHRGVVKRENKTAVAAGARALDAQTSSSPLVFSAAARILLITSAAADALRDGERCIIIITCMCVALPANKNRHLKRRFAASMRSLVRNAGALFVFVLSNARAAAADNNAFAPAGKSSPGERNSALCAICSQRRLFCVCTCGGKLDDFDEAQGCARLLQFMAWKD